MIDFHGMFRLNLGLSTKDYLLLVMVGGGILLKKNSRLFD